MTAFFPDDVLLGTYTDCHIVQGYGSFSSGGTLYTALDVLTVGGTVAGADGPATIRVQAVNGFGTITAAVWLTDATYIGAPLLALTGGTGTGAAVSTFVPEFSPSVFVAALAAGGGFGATIAEMMFSAWYCGIPLGSSAVFETQDMTTHDLGVRVRVAITGGGGGLLDVEATVTINKALGVMFEGVLSGTIPTYDVTTSTEETIYSGFNLLLSWDGAGQTIQAYGNDTALSLSSGGWVAAGAAVNSGLGWLLYEEPPFGINTACHVADVWINDAAVDLSIAANRRGWINADLTAVALPSNGQVGATVPLVFLHTDGDPEDFILNGGLAGAWDHYYFNNGNTGQPLIIPATDGIPLEGGDVTCLTIIPIPPDPPAPVPVPAVVTVLGGYRGQVGINYKGMALVGDAYVGIIGKMSFDRFTEYGNTMQALIVSPPVHKDRLRIFVRKFEIDVESGVGLIEGQGSDPQWMLDWSKDGGRTWSSQQLWRSMGRIGEYTRRLRWLKLGQSRQWIFRLRSTDPVRRVIIGTYLDVEEGMQ